jgi:hypothetical protein
VTHHFQVISIYKIDDFMLAACPLFIYLKYIWMNATPHNSEQLTDTVWRMDWSAKTYSGGVDRVVGDQTALVIDTVVQC